MASRSVGINATCLGGRAKFTTKRSSKSFTLTTKFGVLLGFVLVFAIANVTRRTLKGLLTFAFTFALSGTGRRGTATAAASGRRLVTLLSLVLREIREVRFPTRSTIAIVAITTTTAVTTTVATTTR